MISSLLLDSFSKRSDKYLRRSAEGRSFFRSIRIVPSGRDDDSSHPSDGDEKSVYRQFVQARNKVSRIARHTRRSDWRKVVPGKNDVVMSERKAEPSRRGGGVGRTAGFPLVLFLCAVLSLLPVMARLSYDLGDSVLAGSLRSTEFFCVITGTMALSVPMALDLLLDLVDSTASEFGTQVSALIVSSLWMPGLVLLACSALPELGTLFTALRYFQLLCWVGAALSLLMQLCPDVFTHTRCYAIALFAVLEVYADTIGLISGSHTVRVASEVAKLIFNALSVLISILYFSRFFRSYKDKLVAFQIRNLTSDLSRKEISSFAVCSALMIFSLGSVVYPLALNGGVVYVEDMTSTHVIIFYCLYCTLVAVVSVLPGRVTKLASSRLRSNLDVKRSFVRYVSHEIRTPLNTVFLGLDLVEQRLNATDIDVPGLISMVHDLRESTLIATEILNDLLNYEKLESGIMRLEKTTVYPIPFILKIAKPFKVQAAQKDIIMNVLEGQLQSGSDLSKWTVNIDESKLGQALRNFISNAIKFSQPDSVMQVGASRITGADFSPHLRIEVTDTGHGIAKENQHKVFNEIVQFNANAQQGGGGSGLGLWITKKLVELHGGSVGLHSDGEGMGCTFFLEIPLSAASENDAAVYEWNNGNDAPSGVRSAVANSAMELASLKENDDVNPCAPMQLLVVDDSALNRKMMLKILTFRGHDVTEAADGDEAVERCFASEIPFDAILMDNSMPKMNGTVAARIMRNRGFRGYIIGVTGNGLQDDIKEYLESGADVVVIKPVDLNKFDTTLKDLRSRPSKWAHSSAARCWEK